MQLQLERFCSHFFFAPLETPSLNNQILDRTTKFLNCMMISIKLASSQSLRTCHCAECDIKSKFERWTFALQSNPILRSTIPKTMFWTVLQSWDCFTKQAEPANDLVYWRLVRNDRSRRKIVLIKIVPIILFYSIQFRMKKDLHFSGPSIADGFRVVIFPSEVTEEGFRNTYKILKLNRRILIIVTNDEPSTPRYKRGGLLETQMNL